MNFLSKKNVSIKSINKQFKVYILSFIISASIILIFSLIEKKFVNNQGYILNYKISYQKGLNSKDDMENKIAIRLLLQDKNISLGFFKFGNLKNYFGYLIVHDNICKRKRDELQNDPSIISNTEYLRFRIFFKNDSTAKACVEILKDYTLSLSINFKKLTNNFINTSLENKNDFEHVNLFLENTKTLNIYKSDYKIISVSQNFNRFLYFLIIFILLILLFNEKKIIHFFFSKTKSNRK